MNSKAIMRNGGFSLLELMIVLALIAIFGTSITMALNGMAGWSGKSSSEDALAEDVLKVWKTFNDDLGQSAWWIPDTTQAFGDTSLSTDRGLVYAPYVVQPMVTGGSASGQPTSGRLRIFARAGSGDIRFEGAMLADLDRSHLPGDPSDRLLPPSGFASAAAYRQTYFGRSQELVFVRATNTLWDSVSNRPMPVGGQAPARIPQPIDRFPGTTTDWTAPANHSAIGVLRPSGWQRSGASWAQVGAGPYGQVMDACYLYSSGSTLDLRLQLEQQAQPTFQLQDPNQVRLLCYAVVPSPNGLGRLVRAYASTDPAPPIGTDEGRRIATDGAVSLVVDRVISDNVARVVFDSARHADDIGVNNIRVTVYFAKISEYQRGSPLVIGRAVTMVFAMRAANSWQDKDTVRSRIKTSTAIASGAIPFSY